MMKAIVAAPAWLCLDASFYHTCLLTLLFCICLIRTVAFVGKPFCPIFLTTAPCFDSVLHCYWTSASRQRFESISGRRKRCILPPVKIFPMRQYFVFYYCLHLMAALVTRQQDHCTYYLDPIEPSIHLKGLSIQQDHFLITNAIPTASRHLDFIATNRHLHTILNDSMFL